jgi:transcriptional regulator with XRE-family HTH domain
MESQTARLAKVLKQAIGALGLTQKEVEHRLGLSPGYLSRLFGGQIELKADHVVQIARVLEVEPEEIFRLAFPPSEEQPTHRALRLREAFGAPLPETPPASLSTIEKEIERIVKRALASNRGS